MTPAAAALCIAVLGVVVVTALLAGDRILKAWAQERAEWNRERQILLNRIKPETHQPVTDDDPVTSVPSVAWDDDRDFMAAQQGMTKEQLAEAVFNAEIASGRDA